MTTVSIRTPLQADGITAPGVILAAAATTRVTAPAVLKAKAAGDIVGFTLQNPTAAALGAHYVSFQQAFLPGAVAAGAHLVAIVGGQTIPVQMDVRTTNADGSVRLAMLTLLQPNLAANTSVQAMLSTTGSAQGAALSLGKLSGSAYPLVVTLSLHGGQTVTLDATSLLQKALDAGTVSYWQKGPLATQARFDVAITGSLHVTFDTTLYADGSTSTDVQFANDAAMQASGGTLVYDVKIAFGGKVALQQNNITHYQYQTWHRVLTSNAAPEVNIIRDVDYLERTGAVPNLDLAAGVSASLLAGEVIRGNGILGPGSITQYMPTTGGRPDIGPVPGWDAIWLMTQTKQAAQYALTQADAAGSVPWHFFDPKTGTWLSLADYPTLWDDYRGKPALTQAPSDASGWTPDGAHQPGLSYVAYLLTGSRYYLEQLNAQATYDEFVVWPDARQNGLGLVANGVDQVRQQAWSLRTIDQAAWANPDGSTAKTTFTALSQANWHWLVSQIPAWTKQQGQAHGYVPGDYRGAGLMAPWQQDYFASTAIQAAARGNADALTFLKWESNFLVGRFLHAADGFNPHDGAAYSLNIADASGNPYQTWAQIGAATVAAGNSNGTGWGDGDYATLALQSLAGIITLTGSAEARTAYNWLKASNAPQINPVPDPQLDIVPRQAAAVVGSSLSIAATDADKAEGAAGRTTGFVFTVTRSGDVSGAASAAWAVTGSGGNPANAADFAGGKLPSGTVSFAAGQSSRTITVGVAGDAKIEPDEGFTVTLSGASGATLGTGSATGIIRNDDGAAANPATLSIAASAARKAEGIAGSRTDFVFTVTRTGNLAVAASAAWSVTGRGAHPATGSDFVGGKLPSGTVHFAVGQTSRTITVGVAGDVTKEVDQWFAVTLAHPASGTAVGHAVAPGLILNDDGGQSVVMAGATTTTAAGGHHTVVMPASGGRLVSRGTDTIYAGAGQDTIDVGANTVSVFEGSGRMRFSSGAGSHAVITMRAGGSGSTLALHGDSTIYAAGTFRADDGGIGAGADTFVLTRGVASHVTISEFGDHLHLVGYAAGEASRAVAGAKPGAAGELLRFSDGSTVLLPGLSQASLGWFV